MDGEGMSKKYLGWLIATIILISAVGFLPNSTSAAADGWVEKDGSRYYYTNDQVVKGWYEINEAWYYFNPESGAMVTGWLYHSYKWYYLKQDGAMHTGWLNENGTWYYLKSDGAMHTGWLNQSGSWYYLQRSGAMKTGWLYDSYKWYYLDGKSGKMRTGWLEEGDKWYYLESGGAMKTGWLQYSNRWYFLNRSGIMQTGWVWFGHEWNYFKKNGVWVENTVVDEMETIWDHDQIILVTASGYNSYNAKIRTYEKIDGKWYHKMSSSGYLGKYGFADVMKEGGKESPRGKYTIGTAFGRYENPGTKLPYRKITSDDVWVDDPSSSLYNTWQKASQNNGQWNSAEKMDIPQYNYGFVINYNTEKRVPGAGSAIFFHVASNYTLGCTATSQNHVLSIMRWLDPAKKPIIIQAPESELGEY
jgi:glucan-binding YG repeat protein